MFPARFKRRFFLSLAVLSAAALFAFAACGGSGDGDKLNGGTPAASQSPEGHAAAPTPVGIDPCTLVTVTEAAAALGASVSEPQRGDLSPFVSCFYRASDAAILSVTLITYHNEADARAGFQLAIDANSYRPLGDLGDDAYNAQPIYDVAVLKGIYELSIDIASGDPAAELTQSTELMRTALTRLP